MERLSISSWAGHVGVLGEPGQKERLLEKRVQWERIQSAFPGSLFPCYAFLRRRGIVDVCAQLVMSESGLRTPQPTRFLCAWDFQATMMERVAIAFSRRSSWPRDPTCMSCISCIGRQVLYYSPSEEAWILVLAQPTAAGCPSLTLSFLTCRIRKSDLECLHFLSHLESENHKILGYKDFCNQITQGKAYKNQVLITKNSKKKQKNKKPQNLSWKESLYH